MSLSPRQIGPVYRKSETENPTQDSRAAVVTVHFDHLLERREQREQGSAGAEAEGQGCVLETAGITQIPLKWVVRRTTAVADAQFARRAPDRLNNGARAGAALKGDAGTGGHPVLLE